MRHWLALLAALGLTACAGLTPTGETLTPAPTTPLVHFVADGRISLRQGERSDHLRFRWEHSPASDTVLLMSPLGQGMAQLERDAAGARLVRPRQPPVIATDLRELARQVFGTPLPLDRLADHLRGAAPVTANPVEGWQLRVTDTAPFRQRRLLRVLEISRDDVELKLIVDEWDSNDEP
jgi:outer membrane lipoprotein LolB